MKLLLTASLIGAILGTGCIHHKETVYRDVERAKVEFENETAARLFYEALSRMPQRGASESSTKVSIPVIFEHSRTEIAGNNARFNDAVQRCDTNRDARITELEAKIFAEQVK